METFLDLEFTGISKKSIFFDVMSDRKKAILNHSFLRLNSMDQMAL